MQQLDILVELLFPHLYQVDKTLIFEFSSLDHKGPEI